METNDTTRTFDIPEDDGLHVMHYMKLNSGAKAERKPAGGWKAVHAVNRTSHLTSRRRQHVYLWVLGTRKPTKSRRKWTTRNVK